MSNPFFKQFEVPGWQPLEQPELTDPEWEALFDSGSSAIKTNIANGWLHQFNQEIQRATLKDSDSNFMLRVINDQYQWLRKSLPHITTSLFAHAYFDGTAQGLLHRTSRYMPEKMRIARRGLHDLWFGDAEKQAQGVNALCYVIEQTIAENGNRARRQRSLHIPLVGNLIENLAWDAVKQQPEDLRLHIQAARLSVWYGDTNAMVNRHTYPEDAAWHSLSKHAQYNMVNFEDVHGHNILDIIRNTDPVVAADALPTLMRMVRSDKRPQGYYERKLGLAGAVNKKEADITDFDVLRTWIPSKTKLWDSAELLGLPFQEVCCELVTAAMQGPAATLALPDDLVVN